MLHRTLLIKLESQHRSGLNYVRLKQAARSALTSAHGVQNVRIQRAVSDDAPNDWDLCIIIDYVSGIDQQRSAADPILRAFEQKFLGQRAEKIWSGLFTEDE